MSCNCHLCEPWNELAREYDDEIRLNEIKAQRLAVHGLKPADPAFRLHDYSTPFMRAVLKDQEQERLREYLRAHMERARHGHERTAGASPDAAEGG